MGDMVGSKVFGVELYNVTSSVICPVFSVVLEWHIYVAVGIYTRVQGGMKRIVLVPNTYIVGV